MNHLRKSLSRAVRFAAGRSGRCLCTLCGERLTRWLPYTSSAWLPFKLPPLMRALDIIGSNVAHFSCPHCLCHDRERHLWLYMKACGMADSIRNWRILHMAPEPNLSLLIAQEQPARYVCGDLYPTADSIERVNLLSIPFADESFDLVIANHVLEHIDDDLQALREIKRILSPFGHAVLQTPYAASLQNSWADPGVQTPAARLQAFGQEDHVRLYGGDIFRRFSSVGLLDCCRSHSDLLRAIDPIRFGVNPREPFFLFQKPGTADRALESPP